MSNLTWLSISVFCSIHKTYKQMFKFQLDGKYTSDQTKQIRYLRKPNWIYSSKHLQCNMNEVFGDFISLSRKHDSVTSIDIAMLNTPISKPCSGHTNKKIDSKGTRNNTFLICLTFFFLYLAFDVHLNYIYPNPRNL